MVCKTFTIPGGSSGGGDDPRGGGGDDPISNVDVSNFSVDAGEQIATARGQVNNRNSYTVDVSLNIRPADERGRNEVKKRVVGGASSSFVIQWEFDNQQDVTEEICVNAVAANRV